MESLHLLGRGEQVGRRQGIVDLERSAEVEPFGHLSMIGVGKPAVEDVADGRADQLARDVVRSFELALVLELELAVIAGMAA